MKRYISPEQVAYARHLDREYGRESALEYLKLVTRKGYLNSRNITKAGKEIGKVHRCVYKLECSEKGAL